MKTYIDAEAEGLMLMLKLQYFGHLMWRTDSLEKILMLGKIEGRRRGDDKGWDGWMASSTWWTWVWISSRTWWWTGKLGLLQSMIAIKTEQLNWTERTTMSIRGRHQATYQRFSTLVILGNMRNIIFENFKWFKWDHSEILFKINYFLFSAAFFFSDW